MDRQTKEVVLCEGRTELDVNYFTCPRTGCLYGLIMAYSNFCAKCGQPLSWTDPAKIKGYEK
jgi:hypothetical protein